jgi:hypothetical protein
LFGFVTGTVCLSPAFASVLQPCLLPPSCSFHRGGGAGIVGDVLLALLVLLAMSMVLLVRVMVMLMMLVVAAAVVLVVLPWWWRWQEGARAVVAVLLGDREPTGRLPVTVYDEDFVSSRGDVGNITNMSLRDNGGITYMHFKVGYHQAADLKKDSMEHFHACSSVCLSVSLSVYLSVCCLSVGRPDRLAVCVSVCLSVCM